MSRIITLILVLLVTISCKNEERKVIEVKSTILNNKEKFDWAQFEKNVFETIDSIKKSDSKNRKKLIEKFLNYHDKVDGAVSEAYSNFAFEYVENNGQDFFSVLESNDSLLIKKWSKISSGEIELISENKRELDSIWMKIHENHHEHRLKLKPLQRELDLYYLIKLNDETKKH